MQTPPHQDALRRGRFSTAGAWYSVTTCIHERRALLVPDPHNPLACAAPARVIEACLQWLHVKSHWQCKGYVVMPDHLHVVFALAETRDLGAVMASFGKYTARNLNALLGRRGRVWQHGFYDHCLRDEHAYLRHLQYVLDNPVRKGFVQRAEDWPFSAVHPQWGVQSVD